MLFTETQNQLLAVLFASGDPVEADRLGEAMGFDSAEITRHLAALANLLDGYDFPLQIRRLENSYQLCSRPVYAELIRATLELGRNAPLSPAALEVLAIVAYNQPVTRSFVEQVRGVDSSGVLSSLTDKGLVEEAGRLELPGRPIAYRTTDAFLRCFGLESLGQLPSVEAAPEENPAEDQDDDSEQLDFASLSASAHS